MRFLIEQLFEEKLNKGYAHVNILIKVKDMSVMKDMKLKAFFEGNYGELNISEKSDAVRLYPILIS
jgi:hypothetical protein